MIIESQRKYPDSNIGDLVPSADRFDDNPKELKVAGSSEFEYLHGRPICVIETKIGKLNGNSASEAHEKVCP